MAPANTSIHEVKAIPRVSCSHALPLWETLQGQKVDLTQAPFKLLPLCWAGACETVSMPFKYGVSISCRVKPLFPIALQFSCAQTLLAFKARCFEGSSSQCRTPLLGSPMWGSTPCPLGRTSADVITFPFVVTYLAVWVLTIPVFSPPTRLSESPFLSL